MAPRRPDAVTRGLLLAAVAASLVGLALLVAGRDGGWAAVALAFLLQLGSLLRRAVLRR